MPRDKTETYNKIIPIARLEFLEKGFEGASMRNIAAKVGISAMGLYRHFENKEAMFDAVLKPLSDAIEKKFTTHKAAVYGYLSLQRPDKMWAGQADLRQFIDLMFEYHDEFKLLLCSSQGTRHANYVHRFAALQQEETFKYIEAAKELGINAADIDPLELHLLLSAYYTAIFEIVIHDFSREQAEHYAHTLSDFFYPGWKAILGW